MGEKTRISVNRGKPQLVVAAWGIFLSPSKQEMEEESLQNFSSDHWRHTHTHTRTHARTHTHTQFCRCCCCCCCCPTFCSFLCLDWDQIVVELLGGRQNDSCSSSDAAAVAAAAAEAAAAVAAAALRGVKGGDQTPESAAATPDEGRLTRAL